jgi:hypothetical protein
MAKTVLCATLCGAVLGLACAGKGKGSKEPKGQACLQACDQKCPYTPDALGDEAEYHECLEACHDKCS